MLSSASTLKKIRFDGERWKAAFRENLFELVQGAARAWLEAVVSNAAKKFPVQTGMAKSSLVPLGRFLGVPVSVEPTRDPYDGKSPSAGEAEGQSDGFFQVHSNQYGPYAVDFMWESGVEHFELNELYNMNFGPNVLETPWEFLVDARAAFDDYLASNISNVIPNIKQYTVHHKPGGVSHYGF